jgi:hypothetical protein
MASFTILKLGSVLFRPSRVFADLAASSPSPWSVFFGFSLWLSLLPPIFAYIGTSTFGWRLGVAPMFLPQGTVVGISAIYFVVLVFGFVSTAVISRWMAGTYDADTSLGANFALVTIIGAPLAVGSIVHLYPQAFINALVLVPVLIWCMYLLYRGLPIVLKTDPGRGMLMASALIAYLLVAWVSLLGITVVLWSEGIGPRLGT